MWPFRRRPAQHASMPENVVYSKEFVLSPELARHFSVVENGGYSELWNVEVNLLNKFQAQESTFDLAPHPILQAFDGVVLDDPNTSNYHIYLNHAVLKGSVLFLSHDGDTRLVYSSIAEFMSAVDKAKLEETWLADLHPTSSPITPNQGALSQLISACLDQGNDEGEAAVLALIPSMDLKDEPLLMRLASARNFFFGEAVANAIVKRPSADLLSVAECCTRHGHIQVRNAGRRALEVVKSSGSTP